MLKPVITEQSMIKAAAGWYTFAVPVAMSKPEIIKEAGKRFSVTVVGIRTARMHGKIRKAGRKMKLKKRPDWKKAYVKVKAGQKIDSFQLTEGEK